MRNERGWMWNDYEKRRVSGNESGEPGKLITMERSNWDEEKECWGKDALVLN